MLERVSFGPNTLSCMQAYHDMELVVNSTSRHVNVGFLVDCFPGLAVTTSPPGKC